MVFFFGHTNTTTTLGDRMTTGKKLMVFNALCYHDSFYSILFFYSSSVRCWRAATILCLSLCGV
jgi:hypothetical protein